MRKALWIFALVASLLVVALGAAWRGGLVRAPWSDRYDRLVDQLRDRGTVAVLGGVPLGMPAVETSITDARRVAGLGAALDGIDGNAVGSAMSRAHLDGLLVRTDGVVRAPAGSVAARLATLRPVSGLSAVFVDDTTALYERDEPVALSADDARRLVSVARLVLSSAAAAPSERIFPESLRRAHPVEVGIVVRDGASPLIWRSARGGSIARALLDGTFSLMNRWSTPMHDRYGSLHDALLTRRLTVSIFHDKGVLGARSPEFLRRAAGPGWSVGYERTANWEYVLPASPGAAAVDPVDALRNLARERGVPAPGYLRPEVTLYRFRAVQLIEREPFGAVDVIGDP